MYPFTFSKRFLEYFLNYALLDQYEIIEICLYRNIQLYMQKGNKGGGWRYVFARFADIFMLLSQIKTVLGQRSY